MLEQKSEFAEYCNIRPSFKPVKNKKSVLYAFTCLYLVGTLNFILFNFPKL